MKRFLKITAFVSAVFLVVLIVLGFLLPYIVNLSAIKSRVSRRLSETLKAEVSVRTLRIKVFFRPALSAEGVKIKAPQYLLTVKSLRLYPDLPALLRKKIVIRDFALISPHLTVFLPEKPSGKPFRAEEVLKDLPALPPMEVTLSGGRVQVFRGKASLFDLADLSAELATRPEQILFEGEGKASFLKKFYLKSRLDLKEGAAEGLIEVSGVDLSRLKILSGSLPLSPSQTDFSISLAYTYEDGTLVGGFKGSAPCVRFEKTPDLLFSCAGFEGEFSYGPKGFSLSLKDLEFKEPRLSGEFSFHRGEEGYYLFARLKELDFAALRSRLLGLFPKNNGLKKFLAIVRAGKFTDLELKTRAKTVRDLSRVENLILSARVKGGRINVPKPPLDIFGASGTFTLVMGDLNFNGSGKLAGVNISKASVKVHLKSRKAPLKITADFSGEAGVLLEIAKKASAKAANALKAMSFNGPVSGRLVLSGTRAKPHISFELRPQGVLFTHSFLPSALKVSGGRVFYQKGNLTLSGIGLSGRLGSLHGVSATLSFGRKPYEVKVEELHGFLRYPELEKILVRFPAARDFLEKYQPRIEILEIKSLSYQGPFAAETVRKSLVLKAVLPSGNFFLPSIEGRVAVKKLPVIYYRGKLGFGPGEIRLYGSNFTLSGEAILDSKALSLRGSGQASRELLEFVYRKVSFSEDYLLKTPLEVRDFSLVFSENSVKFSADLSTSEGANLAFSLEREPSFLKVSSGRLVFRERTLLFSLERFSDHYLLNFKGELSPDMVSALIEENPWLKGYLRGDLEVYFHLKRPLMSRFKGRLEGRDFVLPLKGRPYVKNFQVRGVERTFYFEELDLSLAGSDFLASGRLEVASKSFRFEGQVRSKMVDLPKLKPFYEGSGQKKFQVLGHLDLVLDEVRLTEKYSVQNVRGGLFVYPQKTTLVLSEAQFCSLPLNGKVVMAKEKSLDLIFYQPVGKFETLFACLSTSGETLISGPFSLKAEIHLKGRESLFEAGSGYLTLSSPSGVIHRFGLLAKIFGFLSPIDIFKGNLPPLEEKGLPYEKLGLEGQLFGNRFRVEKAFLEGPGLRLFASGDIYLPEGRLDLTVLASPFKTVDTLTSKIPVVGFLLTGKDKMLVSVPMKVKGTYRKPSIVPLHPEAIGEGIFGLFKRVFKIPAKVIRSQ
ncbi:AsmA-like C-terminal domain-containing protein [Thermosulfurimonas dismutans]|uniref:YhdP central domain-containing protein n=1 Tax=Thermosulfurimonas dismutans TaxID=999894 RepID=A0A179D374_9BACT|nr:AsmA-like C-terminal domain-containing protein [Thermosulfurimonas dismutans]OAQ19922.1 hypothetical protein TDIS_1994 [Thermosulfurimonas dismutans]